MSKEDSLYYCRLVETRKRETGENEKSKFEFPEY